MAKCWILMVGWRLRICRLGLFELEKEGRLVPPVDVTLSGFQDDVIAVHFQYQGASGRDRNVLQGDLTQG